MTGGIHRLVISSVVAGALGFAGTAGLSGAGGQVLHVPRAYATIQSAVAAAASGDTVLVAAGTYSENVVVSTPGVRLVGGGDVVLDGAGRSGIGIHVLGTAAAPLSDVEVSHFEVRQFERGITLQWTTNVQVTHNFVHRNLDKTSPAVAGDGFGIELTSASASDISHNIISRNGFGAIRVGGIPGSTGNRIHHNRIDENGTASSTVMRNGQGILLTGASNNNDIQHNEILANNGRGVVITRPLTELPISGILVAHNRLHGNQRAGVAIMGSATANTVVHNDARDNNLSGLGPCFQCNLFDNSVGKDGGNFWDKNLGTFSGTDACAQPLAAGGSSVLISPGRFRGAGPLAR